MASIRPAAVIPAASAPYADGAEEHLTRKGSVCLPGFACNVGDVYGSSLADRGVPVRDVARLTDRFLLVITSLLERSTELGVSVVRLADPVAEAHSRQTMSKRVSPVAPVVRKLTRRGFVVVYFLTPFIARPAGSRK